MADIKLSALNTASAIAAGDTVIGIQSGPTAVEIPLSLLKIGVPTTPTVNSVGAEFHSTAAPTATLPGVHAAGDVLLLILQSCNEVDVAAPSGYTRLGPQNAIGAAATAGSTKLHIFWKRDGGSESAPTIPDTGDHTYGVMLALRGCLTTGDPFRMIGQAFKFTASSTGTAKAGVTRIDNSLIMNIFAHAIDNTGGQGSSPTNASLSSVTEQFDGSTTDGFGGGICVITGTKATAGDVSASTVTWGASTVDVSTTLIFPPPDALELIRSPDVQTFIGTAADLDDTWTKPSGAQRVYAQLCDGGGGGSSGNTTTTPAAGGGGGGGGYMEAEYNASDLGATVTVHAGKGGAANAALNTAGNVGVISQFDKGNAGPLTSGSRVTGTAATAAASADGGNGGCGSGMGQTSPAVSTTRRALNSGNAADATTSGGAPGGSGTTAPVGGSEGDMGGGGGESGADTDAAITSANNGNSMRGAGGGAGGRTNTNVSGPGAGGGAAAPSAVLGANGNDSIRLPYGGSGACAGGGSGTVTGGSGGFPGGGGGGGGGVAGGFGGRGGHGCVVVTTYF